MRRRLRLAGLLALGLVFAPVAIASAHPLGNFTVNRYSRLVVVPGRVRVDYVVDMAEIPTFQAMPGIDTDGDGTATATELADWATTKAADLGSGLEVSVDGQALALAAEGGGAQLLPGQGGLETLRFEGTFTGDAPKAGALVFRDGNFPGQIGWKEVTAVGAEGAVLRGSTVPVRSVSDELRIYPEDLLSSPLEVSEMRAELVPGDSGSAPAPITSDTASAVSSTRPQVEAGALGGVLNRHGFALVLLGLAIAVAFGAWHAMLPGHGKTLMAAYMVGSTSRVRHAATVGTAVAVMHTTSVLALGLLVLTLERTFRPETLYPWLGLLSGLVALGLGAYLLISRVSAWGLRRRPATTHDHSEHETAQVEGVEHDHGLGRHTHTLPEGAPLSPKGILALALAGGILPAPSALIVMLGAVEAHRAAYGIALVLAFSAGLAGALIAVGMGAMKAREAMTKRLSSTVGRLVPIFSASAIVVVGLFLTARGVAQI